MSQVEAVVGRVGRAHGLRGEVVVDVRTDEPAIRFRTGAELVIEGTGQRLTVARTRWSKGSLVVAFEEVTDRTAAEALQGRILVVHVDPDERPDGDDEYYDRQLRGLRVVDPDGMELGVVVDVVHGPAQDLLVVGTGDVQRMVPFVRELVPTVDLAAGTLTVVEPGGLLDDAAEEAR